MRLRETSLENSNLYSLFEPVFKREAVQVAFTSTTRGDLSYADFEKLIGRMANALLSLGLGRSQRVIAQTDKSVESVALYLAVIKIGAVYCPLNTAYTRGEVEGFISDCEPSLFVGADKRRDEFSQIADQFPGLQYVTLSGDGSGSLAQLVDQQSDDHDTAVVGWADIAAIVYTSGTTGRSKGAMLSHGNLISNGLTLHEIWGFRPGDVLLHALPIYHVHGLFIALNTAFLNGSKIIWLETFNVEDVLENLPQASVMMGVPTYYTRLLASPDFDKNVCANMRLYISGSAPLLSETHEEFEARCGHRILERYGMSETGMITSNPYEPAVSRIAGSVGFALPDVEVRVADDNGRILEAGEVGILEVRGPNVFSGYWRMEAKTRMEFRDDGFFITGDLANMDDEGRVTLVGRSKDLIISGGLNVYPREIELVIDELDGVLESAVIGVPHPDFGEAVVAAVVGDGTKNLGHTDAMLADLKSGLAGFKLPKKIVLLDALPRNAMGKVQKVLLRVEFASLFANTL